MDGKLTDGKIAVFTEFQNTTRACLCKWLTVNCYVSSRLVQPYDRHGQLTKYFPFSYTTNSWPTKSVRTLHKISEHSQSSAF